MNPPPNCWKLEESSESTKNVGILSFFR
jgi:hypothetical protein